MVDFDDLRRSTTDDLGFDDDDEIDVQGGSARSTLFLGMTPIERMFISMFLFLNVAVLGIALLLATGRIGG
jgi:hypothetical protein